MAAQSSVVLCASSSDATCEALAQALGNAGFEVRIASTARDTLKLMVQFPDLVVLEGNFPDLPGSELCRRIKQRNETSSIPILRLLPAGPGVRGAMPGIDGEADACLAYPADPAELAGTAAAVLRLRKVLEGGRAAARQWQSAFDSISDPVVVIDRRGSIARCNHAAEELAGRPLVDLAGKAWTELLNSMPGPLEAPPLAGLFPLRQRETIEFSAGKRWFQLTLDPVVDSRGAADGAVLRFSDTTTRRRAEAAIQLRVARAERLMRSGVLATVVGDFSGRISDANQTFLNLVGYTQEELAAGRLRWDELTPPEFVDRDAQAIVELSTAGVCTPFEKEYVRRDGVRVPVIVGFARVGNLSDECVGFVMDLSDRKRAEDEVHRVQEAIEVANRARSEFLAAMSSELRGPLKTVLGSSEILAAGTFGHLNERQKKHAQTIIAGGRQLLERIDAMLEIFAAESEHMAAEPAHFDVTTVLGDVVSIAQGVGKKRDVAITVNTQGGIPPILADPSKFRQILYNLLTTAIHATPAGSSVGITTDLTNRDALPETVRTGFQPGKHLLRVTITENMGLRPPQHQLILRELKQAPGAYGQIEEDSDSGLSRTQRMVELHGGRIWTETAGTAGAPTIYTFAIPAEGTPPGG